MNIKIFSFLWAWNLVLFIKGRKQVPDLWKKGC